MDSSSAGVASGLGPTGTGRSAVEGHECHRDPNRFGSALRGAIEGATVRGACALWQSEPPTGEQTCGANHRGGGGLRQPPADAIEASALRARPRWRGRSAPSACGEPRTQFDFRRQGCMAQPISVARLGDVRPDFCHAGKPKTTPGPFALGGKGLASAAGAANARN